MSKIENKLNKEFLSSAYFEDEESVPTFVKSNKINHENSKTLYNAAMKGSWGIVKYLVENEVCSQVEVRKALFYAARYGHLEIVQYLIVEHNYGVKVALDSARMSPEKMKIIAWCEEYGNIKNLNDKLENDLSINKDYVASKKPKV